MFVVKGDNGADGSVLTVFLSKLVHAVNFVPQLGAPLSKRGISLWASLSAIKRIRITRIFNKFFGS